ncbi:hypothetical protein GCM10011428_02070 [Streptomyces violaceus]
MHHGVGPDEVGVVGLRAEADLACHEFTERGALAGAQGTVGSTFTATGVPSATVRASYTSPSRRSR